MSASESAKTAPERSWKDNVQWGVFAGLAMIVFIVIVGSSGVKRRGTNHATDACVANLKQIEGAKEAWALEHHKQLGDMPTEADLFGPVQYIQKKSECPLGGVYTLGAIGKNPKCSIAKHNRQFEEDQQRSLANRITH